MTQVENDCQNKNASMQVAETLDLLSGMSDLEQLEGILSGYPPTRWFTVELLPTIAQFRPHAASWGLIKATFKDLGGNTRDLEAAVDEWLSLCGPKPTASATTPAPIRPAFQPITACDLYVKDLPPLAYVVEEILPVGATLFVGRAKDGKSLAMWNLCLAVAEGGLAFGRYQAQQGDCLYLALEDGERRAKKRLIDQMQASGMTAPPSRLSLVLWDAPRLGEGLEEALNAWLDAHASAKLVVIDILEKVRPRRTKHGSVYADDYAALAPLQRLAQERGIAIVVVHHANKVKADDFRDSISGSMSLAGAADTLWVLQRLAGEADAALRITGRDIDTLDLALQFQDGFWTSLGDAEDYRLSQVAQEVIAVLRQSAKPLTPKQLAGILGVQEGTMRARVVRMAERGEVLNVGDGRYIARPAPSPVCPDPVTHVTDVTPVTEVTPITPLPQEDVPQDERPVKVGIAGDEVAEEPASAVEFQESDKGGVTLSEPLTPSMNGVYTNGDARVIGVTGVTSVTGVTARVPFIHDHHTPHGTHGAPPSVTLFPVKGCRHRHLTPDAVCRDCGEAL